MIAACLLTSEPVWGSLRGDVRIFKFLPMSSSWSLFPSSSDLRMSRLIPKFAHSGNFSPIFYPNVGSVSTSGEQQFRESTNYDAGRPYDGSPTPFVPLPEPSQTRSEGIAKLRVDVPYGVAMLGLVFSLIPSPVSVVPPCGPTIHRLLVFAWNATLPRGPTVHRLLVFAWNATT
jgi:hypothetical protein